MNNNNNNNNNNSNSNNNSNFYIHIEHGDFNGEFLRISNGFLSFEIIQKMRVPHVNGIINNPGYICLCAVSDKKYDIKEDMKYHSRHASIHSIENAIEYGMIAFKEAIEEASSCEGKISIKEFRRRQEKESITRDIAQFKQKMKRYSSTEDNLAFQEKLKQLMNTI